MSRATIAHVNSRSTVASCRYCVRGLHVEHLRGNADNCRVCHEPERVCHEPARAPPESERNWNLAGRKCHEPGVTLVEHPASMITCAASVITAAITQVAANKLKIKTDVKCDLGSSHCYVAFSAFDCHIVTREPGSVVDSRLRVAKTSSPSPNSVMHDDPQ